MKSRLTLSVVLALALVLIPVKTFAATFALTKIGSLDLGGKAYSEWWYTALNPTFYGTAASGAKIDITADGDKVSTTANSQGAWSQPMTLDSSDHDITITDGTNTYSFKLHLGQDFPGNTTATTTTQTSSSTSTVPQTGMDQTIALLLGTGVSLLALYFYFFETNKKHRIFERDIVSRQ